MDINYIKKMILSCLGMLVILCLPWMLFITFKMCTATRVEKEIHLIPKDYRGDVFILFNRKDGTPPKYGKNKERIYEIPNTGVLETTLAPNNGGFSKSDCRFYYVDENNHKIREFNWLSSFGLHHKSYEKNGSTIGEDSLLVFNLTNNVVFDSIPGIKPYDNKEFIFYTIDSFKNRPIGYK